MTKQERKARREASFQAVANRFDATKTYKTSEHEIDILQQHGASRRKVRLVFETKTYKRFSNA